MVDAEHASADFYCDGSAEPTAQARLLPRALWREIPEHGLVVVGVDGEPLRGLRIWPLVPSPEVMAGLAATMGEVGAGPTLATYSHVHGVTKTEHVLHLDEYDVRSDRLFLRDPAPVQCHGSPVFYAGQWVGVVDDCSSSASGRGVDATSTAEASEPSSDAGDDGGAATTTALESESASLGATVGGELPLVASLGAPPAPSCGVAAIAPV